MIILSAGHDSKFHGCENPTFGIREHALALNICDLISERYRNNSRVFFLETDHMVETYRDDLDSLDHKIAQINALHKLTPVQLALEIHFNASPEHTAMGAECLYYRSKDGRRISAKGKAFCEIFQPLIEDFDGKYDGRPIKHFYTLLFLRRTNCPAIIIEPLFLDNAQDAAIITTHDGRIRLVNAICRGIDQVFIKGNL